jgi:hypothetical protein
MHSNLTLYSTPLFDNDSFSEVIDYTLDETIDGAYNFSDLSCPSSYQNFTYLNVSCDTALDFSIPLYGSDL